MTNILPFLKTADSTTHAQAISLCQQAADEIERLRAALQDIAERGHIITNGDPAVLRNRARVELGLEPVD